MRSLLVLSLVMLLPLGCDGTRLTPTEPTPPPTSSPSSPPTGAPAAQSTWSGTSTVQSAQGTLPSCVPSFLRTGFSGGLSAEFIAEPDRYGRRMLVLKEPSSGDHCTLEIRSAADARQIQAVTYYRKPMDDTSLDCHFLVRASKQECPSLEVWALDLNLEGTFSQDRRSLSGTLERSYDFRVDSNADYRMFIVEKHFVAQQVTP